MKQEIHALPCQQSNVAVCGAGRPAVSAEAIDQLAAGGHVLAAAAWLQHGSPDLAAAAALTALGCHPRTARGEDACLAYAQLATLAFQRRGYR